MSGASHDQEKRESTTPDSPRIAANVHDDGIVASGDDNTIVGEKGVYVGGNVQGSIKIGDVINYISHPPPLSVLLHALGHFFKRNYLLLSLIIISELPLFILFFHYKDRFRLWWTAYLILAVLLGIVVWGWLNLWQARSTKQSSWRSFLTTSTTTFVWGGLLGLQIQAVLFPPQFLPSQFGIAIATFGEGPDFYVTPRGRQISDLLFSQLDETINSLGLADVIAVTRLGVVKDSDQGRVNAERVGAKLVIWGQILEGDDGVIILFQVLETDNLTDNPSFPQTLPVTRPPLQGRVEVESTNSLTVKQIAEPQIVSITAFTLGLFYYLDPDYKLAAQQFEVARNNLEDDGSDGSVINLALVYYYLGRSYQLLGKFEQSQEILKHALELNPDDPAILLGLMYNYRVFGQETQKQQTLEKILTLCRELPKDSIPLLYDCALAYESMKEDEAALREYEAIQKVNPDFFIAYLSAGRILVRFERFEEAEVMYQQATLLAEGDPTKQAWVHLDNGKLYEKREENEAAVAAYQRATELDNSLAMPLFYLAELYKKMGIIDAAIVNYKKLTEVSNNPYWSHGIFADYLYEIGHYSQAIDNYLEALRYDPYNEALLRTHLGRAYTAVDDDRFPDKETSALEEFEQALQNPDLHEAYIRSNYGIILFQFGHFDQAIAQLERSLELEADLQTRLNLAQMFQIIGESEKAKSIYETLIEQSDQISEDKLRLIRERLELLGE